MAYRSLGKPDEPEIPALAFTVAIPEGAANIAAFTEHTVWASLKNIFLLPKGDAKGERKFSPLVYKSYKPYRSYMSAPAKIRTMNIVSVTVPLADFSSEMSTIQAKKKFTCGITFTLPSQLAQKNISDPVFEQLYVKTVANASDILRFRSGFHTSPTNKKNQPLAFSNPTFDKRITGWIDPGAPYIKLYATALDYIGQPRQ